MSHITADTPDIHALSAPVHPQLNRANIEFAPGVGRGLGLGFLVLGAAGIIIAAALGYLGIGNVWARQALASYHVGTMSVLAICLGSAFFQLIFHLLNAGWTGTVRRQFENVSSFLPYAFLMVAATLVVEIVTGGQLFSWLKDSASTDYLLNKKATYFFLNQTLEPGNAPFPLFWVLRAVIYGAFWTFLSRRLMSLSLEQDRTGDRWLTAKARRFSAWALPLLALTTAFAGFDWLMTLDFAFFSTMWGVYFFAGAMFAAAATVTLVLALLRRAGKLEGAVTEEHFHDMGKLMFAFTIFWAYIAFSQYFLIWYANIPEETAYYIGRERGGWYGLGVLLIFGHFVAPFLILLFRGIKRRPNLLILIALWSLVIHALDHFWIVRPMVYAVRGTDEPPLNALVSGLVDVAAIAGVFAVFAGFLILRIPSRLLVAINDPRMDEALAHKNYV